MYDFFASILVFQFLGVSVVHGWVLTARLFGVPPADADGVVGNSTLIRIYEAYATS